jgi:hypothetical protein
MSFSHLFYNTQTETKISLQLTQKSIVYLSLRDKPDTFVNAS